MFVPNDGTCAPDFLFMPNWIYSTLAYNGGTVTAKTAEILNGSVVQFALGTNSRPIHVTSNLTLGATLSITNGPGFTTGTSLSYQWLWSGPTFTNGPYVVLTNGGRISGATSSTLVINNVFATTAISNSVPAYKGGGGVFFYPFMTTGDTYTYQATGCVTIHGLYTADAAGDLYTNGNCTPSSLFAGPTPQWGDCVCPGRAGHSLVDRNTCAQIGTNGLFQSGGSWVLLDLVANDNSWLDNSGSWEVTLAHTVEGAYSCIVSSSCGAQISTGATLYVSTPCDGIPDKWRMDNFGTTDAGGNRCASCYYTNSPLDNLQDYECGFDPRVPIVISTPPAVGSAMFITNTASVLPAATNLSYAWSVTDGVITAGQGTTNISWVATSPGTATLSVTLSNSPSCSVTISTTVAVVNHAYYVDYQNGNDSRTNGLNPLSPWQHCPGDPAAPLGSGPKTVTLYPSDGVFFKGGVTYVLENTSLDIGDAYGTGIGVTGGSSNNPVVYDGQSWTGTKAQITDNVKQNNLIAFVTANGGMANVIIKGFSIGPIGGVGTNALPSYTDTSFTSVQMGSISSGTSPMSIDGNSVPGYVPAVQGQSGCASIALDNSGTTAVHITNVVVTGGSSITFNGSLPITNGPGSHAFLSFCFQGAPNYGSYTSSVALFCDNGQILTNLIIGQSELPPSSGWGVWSEAGGASNVQILNCDFSGLGYWQNSPPVGIDSFGLTSCGVQADGWVNCVISNCTFTRVHTGIELSYIQHPISNLTVAGCDIHDYIVWGIDLSSSPASACADYIFIHDNLIHDIGWPYYAGWTGYTGSDGSGQHQDPIFHRVGAGGTVAGCNGTNIDVYNNIFYDSEHTDSVSTAYLSLTGGVSANIYNNLFNLPNFNLFIYRNIDDIATSNSLVRFLNNTVIYNTTNGNNVKGFECEAPDNQWSVLHTVVIENNVFYDFITNGVSGSDYALVLVGANTSTIRSNFTIDHNLYRTLNWANAVATWSGGGPGDLTLSGMRAQGWDINSAAADPLFQSLAYSGTTNALHNDYHLTQDSPAINQGTNLSGLNLPGLNADRDGKSRPGPGGGSWDIGAYQH